MAKWTCCFLTATMLLWGRPAGAQLFPVNEAGVGAGHEHFRATDVDAGLRFWTALGGRATKAGGVPVVAFPGVFIAVGLPPARTSITGGSRGSRVDRIRIDVKDLQGIVARIRSLGYAASMSADGAATVTGPHGALVELVRDGSLTTPAAPDALIMKVPNPTEAAAWYAKWFGARIVTRDGAVVAEFPGVNIRFEATNEPLAPTRGRALDHIGFEVKDLEAFVRRAAAAGLQFQRPYTVAPAPWNPPMKALAFLVDPWGTSIELNEGFSLVK